MKPHGFSHRRVRSGADNTRRSNSLLEIQTWRDSDSILASLKDVSVSEQTWTRRSVVIFEWHQTETAQMPTCRGSQEEVVEHRLSNSSFKNSENRCWTSDITRSEGSQTNQRARAEWPRPQEGLLQKELAHFFMCVRCEGLMCEIQWVVFVSIWWRSYEYIYS